MSIRPENPYNILPYSEMWDDVHSAFEHGADAMLQKVVEWLAERFQRVEYIPECGRRDAPYQVISDADWQALRRAAGVEV